MRKIPALLSQNALAEKLVSLAREKNITFGTAESCTGGLISAAVTDISGASSVFWGGIVSYDNSILSNKEVDVVQYGTQDVLTNRMFDSRKQPIKVIFYPELGAIKQIIQ